MHDVGCEQPHQPPAAIALRSLAQELADAVAKTQHGVSARRMTATKSIDRDPLVRQRSLRSDLRRHEASSPPILVSFKEFRGRYAQRPTRFTLIEIMVWSSFSQCSAPSWWPKILGECHKARVTRAQSDIRAIQTALDLYRLDNFNTPPPNRDFSLVKQPGGPHDHQHARRYLGSLPKDPWNNTISM